MAASLKQSLLRGQKPHAALPVIFAGLAVVLFCGYFFVDDADIRVRRLFISAPAFVETLAGKKIVHLSDMHFDRRGGKIGNRILEILNDIQPDVILLTGDYVKWHGGRDDYGYTFDFLSRLQAPLGVYAVMGDADYSFSRQSCMFCHRAGSAEPPDLHSVRFLRDDFVNLKLGGKTLRIAGIDCWPRLEPDLALTDSLIAREHPTILLCHTSLIYAPISAAKDVLVLSGDTHGGQIHLPDFFWELTKRKPDPGHIYGFFQEGSKMLYVTSGIGTTDIPVRLGVPPEIVVFEFGEKAK